jgi:mRNA interferase MazF
VVIPEGLPVKGALLADQVKSLDWRARKAEYTCSLPEEIVTQALMKLGTLLAP